MLCMSLSFGRCDAAMARRTSTWGGLVAHIRAQHGPPRQACPVTSRAFLIAVMACSSVQLATWLMPPTIKAGTRRGAMAESNSVQTWTDPGNVLSYGDGSLPHVTVVFDVSATATTNRVSTGLSRAGSKEFYFASGYLNEVSRLCLKFRQASLAFTR